MSKPGKFCLWGGFQCGFYFKKIKEILGRSKKKSKLIRFKFEKFEASTNFFSKNVTYLLLLYLNLGYSKIIDITMSNQIL